MSQIGKGCGQLEEGRADGYATGVTAFHILSGSALVNFRGEVVGRYLAKHACELSFIVVSQRNLEPARNDNK